MPYKDPEVRRAYHTAYNQRTVKQRVAANKQRREAAPEKTRAQARARYAKNREKLCAYNRPYYAAHREKITARERALYALNRDHMRRYLRAWAKKHPEKGERRKLLRRIRHLAGFIEHVNLDVLYQRDKGICSICHKKVLRNEASKDHIIPLARGGEHSYKNCALAHLLCNIRKREGVVTQQMRLF